MNNLQQLLQEIIEKEWTTDRLLAALLKRKFRTLGLTLSDDQRAAIDKQVQEGALATIHIDLTDEQIISLGNDASLEVIELTGSDIEDFESEMDTVIEEATIKAIEIVADSAFDHWLQEGPERLAEHRTINRSFESRLRSAWKKPLTSLEMLIALCLQFGDDFNSEFRPEASRNSDYVFEALTRLHARACQIAGEAFVLLRSGYADGAMARWRTLHELCVTALYIRQEGQEVAERYLAHQHVTEYDQAKTYQDYCSTLGYEPIENEVLAELKAASEYMCAKYGETFCNMYGWAPQTLNTKGQVRFQDIEQAVEMTALKPFVRMANSRVHGGAHAAYHSLGLHPYAEEVLIAGQSMFGLGIPAQNVAYSLALTTVTLLLYEPDLNRTATCAALQKLRDRVYDEVEIAESIIDNKAAKDAK